MVQEKIEKNSFNYTYSADEQEEIKKIRQKYEPEDGNSEENKMDKIRKIDAKVTQKATRISVCTGIIGTLVMGMGMSLLMSDFGEQIHLVGLAGMTAGVVIGVLGITLVCLAYPLYNRTLKKEREKVAPEVLRLTEELMR